MGLTVGVDVGGTKIASGVIDESGRVVGRDEVPTPDPDSEGAPEAIATAIAGLVRGHCAKHDDVEAVGIGAAGFVDKKRAMVIFAPNIPWRDEPLRERVQSQVDLPVVVENDANAAAWAEFQFGAGEDVDDLVMLTVGTGIGGGIVLDGELYRGRVRRRGGGRPSAGGAPGRAVRLRQPRLLGAVRERPGAVARRP